MNKESTKNFLIAFTILWGLCFIPSLILPVIVAWYTYSILLHVYLWNILVPFVSVLIAVLFPVFIVQSIFGSWANYRGGKFKEARRLAFLPMGHFTVTLLVILVFAVITLKSAYWPTSAEEYEAQAEREMFEGKYQQALDDFSHCISLHPSCENFGIRGAAYELGRNYIQAANDYKEAAKLASTGWQKAIATYYTARAYYLAERYEKALGLCSSVPKIRNHGTIIYRTLALRSKIYGKLGKPMLARKDIGELRKSVDKSESIEELLDLGNPPAKCEFSAT